MNHKRNIIKFINILSDGKHHHKNEFLSLIVNNSDIIKNYIKILETWGLNIINISRDIYIIGEDLHLIDKKKINKKFPNLNIIILPIVNSTNQYLIDKCLNSKFIDICIAEYQTHGRGRREKKWLSYFGKNLCFSLNYEIKNRYNINGISIMIGITIIKVLNLFGIKESKIKWPNDLYLKNKKFAGILTEVIKKKDKYFLIIGIGINLYKNKYFISLQDAGILIDKNKLIIELIIMLYKSLKIYKCWGLKPFIKKWNEIDQFINCPIMLKIGNKKILGIDRGINIYGQIILEVKGKLYTYIGNEISLRKN